MPMTHSRIDKYNRHMMLLVSLMLYMHISINNISIYCRDIVLLILCICHLDIVLLILCTCHRDTPLLILRIHCRDILLLMLCKYNNISTILCKCNDIINMIQ